MSKQFEDEDVSQEPAEQDVVALIKRVQQQLVLLERKVDILLRKSETKPAGERHFAQPFRPSGSHHRPSGRRPDGPSGDGKFRPGRYAGRGRGEEGRDSGYNKKSYGSSRESSTGQDRYVKGRPGDKKKMFGKRK